MDNLALLAQFSAVLKDLTMWSAGAAIASAVAALLSLIAAFKSAAAAERSASAAEKATQIAEDVEYRSVEREVDSAISVLTISLQRADEAARSAPDVVRRAAAFVSPVGGTTSSSTQSMLKKISDAAALFETQRELLAEINRTIRDGSTRPTLAELHGARRQIADASGQVSLGHEAILGILQASSKSVDRAKANK